MAINRVELFGNLTRDPEIRFSQTGTAVVNFGIAVTEKYKVDGVDKESTAFVDITGFGKRGELFAQNHKKGSKAFVIGKLKTDTWDDKTTGKKMSKLAVNMESFEFLDSKPKDSAPTTAAPPTQRQAPTAAPGADPDKDDVPF